MGKLYKAVSTILLTIMIIIAAMLFIPRLLGVQPLAVLSGSMEPVYHVGSLIYVVPVDPVSIEVGDPVTYLISENTMVTHRVVEKDDENRFFKTKGDANETPDGGMVMYTNVVGKPVFSVPYLGYLAVYVGTKSGRFLWLTVIAMVLILTFLPDVLMKRMANDSE